MRCTCCPHNSSRSLKHHHPLQCIWTCYSIRRHPANTPSSTRASHPKNLLEKHSNATACQYPAVHIQLWSCSNLDLSYTPIGHNTHRQCAPRLAIHLQKKIHEFYATDCSCSKDTEITKHSNLPNSYNRPHQ